MPGTFRNSPHNSMMRQPPPVAPKSGAARVTVQSWQSQVPKESHGTEPSSYGNHVRCSSLDSVDSNTSTGSSSESGAGQCRQLSVEGEFIPTRTVTKTPSLPSHNPMQYVKVQSPLYKKAAHQMSLVKEIKAPKGTTKETEEEWQSNLDNWKSRRRKVSEKVIQRAEEIKQIEQEEQLRQHREQQRKIKTFSEIMGKRSSKRNYNLDLYVGQGEDSGLGGTPEPDDQEGLVYGIRSNSRSDTSEGMTSETDSIDSDAHTCEKVAKEPPKVPRKPHAWLTRQASCEAVPPRTSPNSLRSAIFQDPLRSKSVSAVLSSEVEGHSADVETSEDDAVFCTPVRNVDSGLESLGSHQLNDTADSASDLSQDSCSGGDKEGQNHLDQESVNCNKDGQNCCAFSKEEFPEVPEHLINRGEQLRIKIAVAQILDTKEFGFSLSSGKNDSHAFVENVIPGGPADLAGLKIGDNVLSINGKSTFGCNNASLDLVMKYVLYYKVAELLIQRLEKQDVQCAYSSTEDKEKTSKRDMAFAQRLALFDGRSSPTNNSFISSQFPRTKASKEKDQGKESLVLRRRSTFEKSSSEREPESHSSCSAVTDIKNVKDDRRFSLDCGKTSETTTTTIECNKKKLPPPIPVKPKPRNKLQKQETIQSKENISVLNNVSSDIYDSDILSQKEAHCVEIPQDTDSTTIRNGDISQPNESAKCYEDNSVQNFNNDDNVLQYQQFQDVKQQLFKETSKTFSSEPTENFFCDPVLNDELQNEVFDVVESQVWNFHTTIDHSISPDYIENDVHTVTSEFSGLNIITKNSEKNDRQECPEDFPQDFPQSPIEKSIITVQPQLTDPDQDTVNSYRSVVYFESPPSDNVSRIQIDCSESSPSEQPDKQYIEECSGNESASNNFETDEVFENIYSVPDDAKNSFEYEESPPELMEEADEYIEKNQCHPSNLAIDKTEEDDIASGGTSSSSSDSRDTETVIDNLPINISPLPNDEIIDMTSVNQPVESREFQSLLVTQPSENLEAIAEENSFEAQDSVHLEQHSSNNFLNSNDYSEGCDNRNQELCENELEESADQLSPLDVIDQMELKLMQQLEQQALEDFTEVTDGQLEEEVNRQLLYLSEDSSLLDDLDAPPRNRLPPSEPPPPPPPELEKESFQRVNSTKRIKKEIWRRRSDFLGLDAPDGINVDDLPPPPPGLEELLKSEMETQREQRLFIEKRLSIVDAEYSLMSDPMNSNLVESSLNCNIDKEYTTECGLEVLDAEVFDAVASDDPNAEWIIKDECQISVSGHQIYETSVDVINEQKDESKLIESPQHKAKSHIQTLGAAPRAKIVDSNKWITQTEPVPVMKQRSVDPVFQHGSYNQNFWLAQETSQNTIPSQVHTPVDRRYSMPLPYGSKHPDVTVRTWDDRKIENQLQPRPKSAIWPAHSSTVAQPPSYYVPTGYFDGSNTHWTDNTSTNYEEEKNVLGVNHSCSCCRNALSEGSAMGIDALQLYFHIECFRCCICHLQLGNGSCGTDVQVKNSQLYCPKCFSIE